MALPEPVSIAFILRFWLERSEDPNLAPFWRGVVEHIPSGKRIYFESIESLPGILMEYIDAASAQNPEIKE